MSGDCRFVFGRLRNDRHAERRRGLRKDISLIPGKRTTLSGDLVDCSKGVLVAGAFFVCCSESSWYRSRMGARRSWNLRSNKSGNSLSKAS